MDFAAVEIKYSKCSIRNSLSWLHKIVARVFSSQIRIQRQCNDCQHINRIHLQDGEVLGRHTEYNNILSREIVNAMWMYKRVKRIRL
jgi:hypothetical protein